MVTLETGDEGPLPEFHVLEGLLESNGNRAGNSYVEEDTGVYAFYEGSLPAISPDVKLILFFASEECLTCFQLESNIIENLNSIPNKIFIMKVEMEKYEELVDKYSVNTAHTLVQVDRDGEELARWQGSLTLEQLLEDII